MLGQEALLVEVISNLLASALKFVAADVARRMRIWSARRGEQVRFWMEDNGFERVHYNEAWKGTGIGLAIVRRAVGRMSGTVGVESDGDMGSRSWRELPSVPDEARS